MKTPPPEFVAADVALAFGGLSFVFGTGECREEKARENSNDRDNDQQFDQCKTATCGRARAHTREVSSVRSLSEIKKAAELADSAAPIQRLVS